MHIVHSVFSEAGNQNQSKIQSSPQNPDEDFYLRLLAHQQVCNKYHEEIMAIRKYLPDWKPLFNE
ncbi:hypothetical protein [Mucilaginibacter jinjuensis]|uniref:Uncharacterized protein n=1 Tax=Mucilaginibacter jinjuensis TaxID=1176721 RepID=A0ABY7TBV7_9SPHI|nr:hypothetical protein [Mucilaginibacter jinjuensis]WCT13193.1 hypothetical protein PQO05_04520 [Mucilaginibacter jinjuensis]